MKVLGLVEVVIVHFPVDTGADQLPHRDPLFRHLEQKSAVVTRADVESRFVPDLHRRRHGYTVLEALWKRTRIVRPVAHYDKRQKRRNTEDSRSTWRSDSHRLEPVVFCLDRKSVV